TLRKTPPVRACISLYFAARSSYLLSCRNSWGPNMTLKTLLLLVAGAAAPADVVTERVLGPEVKTPYNHPASITELQNGDLYIAYYGGPGEYSSESTVYGTRLPRGEKKWTTPAAITPRPKEPEGNAVVWQAPDDVVWLFSVARPGATWSTSWIMARTSAEGARTWSEPQVLAGEAGMMVRGKPIVL